MTAERYFPLVRAALRLERRLSEEGKHKEGSKVLMGLLDRFGVNGDEYSRSYCLLAAASALLRDQQIPSARDTAHVIARLAIPNAARPRDLPAETTEAHAWSIDPAINAIAKACDAFDRGEPARRIEQHLGMHLGQESPRVANERWRANNLYQELLGELAPRPKTEATTRKRKRSTRGPRS
jgi:hypothetical protein